MAEWDLDITRQDPNNRASVVFVHGFQGDPKTTWAEFPRLLAADSNMNGWDLLSLGYQSNLSPGLTGIWEGDPAIQTIADSLGTFARTQLAPKYQGLVLIAHSMGGLAVQRALLDHPELTERVDKVILFGTPSFGLVKAWLFQLPVLRSLNRQVRDMGRTSDFILSLRGDWAARFEQGHLPFSFLAVAGSEDDFVPRGASIDGFRDEHCAVVPGNHLQIVKPADASDASVSIVLDFVGGNADLPGRRDTAALALERREFQKVEKQLGPNRASLDSRAMVDLALALDALGKRAEAMDVLVDAKRHGTDAIGVLAGRHKRNWIQDRLEEEARSAVELYSEAYDTAEGQGDAAQAYYHGINLAFLALVYEADRPKARELAQKVLAHCAQAEADERPQDRMWRLATEGEANLILGNTDSALERYAKAFEGPPKPKPWQFLSTSQQALRIADELGDEDIAQRLLELFGGRGE